VGDCGSCMLFTGDRYFKEVLAGRNAQWRGQGLGDRLLEDRKWIVLTIKDV